jgi:chemotaxis protein methyltransferase CheR
MTITLPSAVTDHDSGFDRFSRMVQDSIGVCLPKSKRIMVESRLRRRLVELGLKDVEAYFRHLFDNGALHDELETIFDAVTTNKTDFFREPQHFKYLTERVIPERLSRKPANNRPTMVKIWSAAASNGAEAYTTAMVLAELETRQGPFEWRILGTDINQSVLSEARSAIYSDLMIQPVSEYYRDRFLLRGQGQHDGKWRVVPDLRRRVNFRQMNLIDAQYPVDTGIDVIFLRNVLIYFSQADQNRVVEKLADHLAHRGHFFVGHAEGMLVRHRGLRQVGPAIYRKE